LEEVEEEPTLLKAAVLLLSFVKLYSSKNGCRKQTVLHAPPLRRVRVDGLISYVIKPRVKKSLELYCLEIG